MSSAVALCTALALCGCASAYNYTDPKGPRVVSGLNEPVAARADRSFKVVTFNVEYGRRVDEAIEALRKPPVADADAILLQEMDAGGVEKIAGALGLNSVYYPASRPPQTTRSFGNAVLSRYAILESHKVPLPGVSRGIGQARASVAATLEVGALRVVVYSVHLSSPVGMSGNGRARQLEAIVADARDVRDPVVLAGDFNSGAIGGRLVAEGYSWATQHIGHSIGPFTYDHVFVRGLRLASPESVGVAKGGPRASDHWPVWAGLVDEREEPASADP